MADLLPRNRGVTKYNIAARRHQPSPSLVCVRLRQRSLLLLTGLFTHKSLRDGCRGFALRTSVNNVPSV
ncbi:hypothetical protein TNCV_558151 [Trichonephila clavipes]|nr:hypothetical protein TNCV_558151 [Trichonephila clavipes]